MTLFSNNVCDRGVASTRKVPGNGILLLTQKIQLKFSCIHQLRSFPRTKLNAFLPNVLAFYRSHSSNNWSKFKNSGKAQYFKIPLRSIVKKRRPYFKKKLAFSINNDIFTQFYFSKNVIWPFLLLFCRLNGP